MSTSRVRWSIVEDSFDEAEFLWGKRERVLDSHAQNLANLSSWTENRLLGAMDGILVAGDAAVETLLAPALAGESAWRASVATFVLASMGGDAALAALTSALRVLPPERLTAVRKGLELGGSDVWLERVGRALGTIPSHLLALFTDVRASLGGDATAQLGSLLADPDENVQAAAVRLARNSPQVTAAAVAEHGLRIEQPEIRIEAVELGLMVGLPAAWTVGMQILAQREPGFARMAIAAAALGGERERPMLLAALEVDDFRRDVLFALGFAGSRAAAEACLAAMRGDYLPKVAGESFCTITGLDLAREGLVCPEAPAPAEPVPFEEEDLEADLVPTADDDLPLPDAAGVARWWEKNHQRFQADSRFIVGQPFSLVRLHERLLNGPMRRRHGWAFELAVRTAGAHQIRTRAFAATQQAQLRAAASAAIGAGPARVAPADVSRTRH
jgi:uncharacterized protein (TIGR02270 family)